MNDKRLRIVIADDEPIIRLDLKKMLEDCGYDVVAEAGDGARAVEAGPHAQARCRDSRHQNARNGRHRRGQDHHRREDRAGPAADRLQPDRSGEPRQRSGRLLLSRQAVQRGRPDAADRSGRGPLGRLSAYRGAGRRPGRQAGNPQSRWIAPKAFSWISTA